MVDNLLNKINQLHFRLNKLLKKNKFSVTVTDQNGAGFKGIFLQAQKPNGTEPLGVWQKLPNNLKAMKCKNANDAVTHSSPDFKISVTLEWLPEYDYGDILFKFIVSNYYLCTA